MMLDMVPGAASMILWYWKRQWMIGRGTVQERNGEEVLKLILDNYAKILDIYE